MAFQSEQERLPYARIVEVKGSRTRGTHPSIVTVLESPACSAGERSLRAIALEVAEEQ
jgi:hypothetical protein